MGRRATAERPGILIGSASGPFCSEAQQVFEAAGYRVVTASSDTQLVDALPRELPVAVLLAFERMGRDGYSLCRRVSEQAGERSLPVVVAVDEADGRSIAGAYGAGASDVVRQPVEWTVLLHRIEWLRQRGHATTELRRAQASLDSLQRIAGVGSWAWDTQSGAMQWSPQLYAILGFAPGDVKANFEHFTLCMHPEDRDPATTLFHEASDDSRPFAIPLRVVLGTGSV
jgi:DNA-binding response OmpR family regulator